MKLLRISIENWRNFSTADLEIPDEANLVCLIGENGTGKSNLLELLSDVSHQFGLTPGQESRRGNPLQEPHSRIEVALRLTEEPEAMLGTELWANLTPLGVGDWDGTLTYRSVRDEDGSGSQEVYAGGIADDNMAMSLATNVTNWLRQFSEVHHVYLDADRAYPPRPVQPHELAEVLDDQWVTQQASQQWAFRSVKTLYEQWAKFLFGQEERAAAQHMEAERRAKDEGTQRPEFLDHFETYRESLQKVLPHLTFRGIVNRVLTFDSAGQDLAFESLSGGEREIAFLIGQIDRFQLTRGLLLLDEPELHLNPDLLRTWLNFVVEGITDGQVWIATHAMEAVEVVGSDATFILEREGDTRLVSSAKQLGDRQVLAVLSKAVGSPAFALHRLRFVFIEAEMEADEPGERERFYSLCGAQTTNRFMPSGGGRSVVQSVQIVRFLANETGDSLMVGGVVDRDFKSDEEAAAIAAKAPVFVLGCHEIENLFLHPDVLQHLADQAGEGLDARTALVESSDRFAGLWALQSAVASLDGPSLTTSSELRKAAGSVKWTDLEADPEHESTRLAALQPDLPPERTSELAGAIRSAMDEYRQARESDDLWKRCLGKQVLSSIPGRFGFRRSQVLERHVRELWAAGLVQPPDELNELRTYVEGIAPTEPAVGEHAEAAVVPRS